MEQFWHLGFPADERCFSFSAPAEAIEGWRSRALCSREAAAVRRVTLRGPLPAHVVAVLDLSQAPVSGPLEMRIDTDSIRVARAPWSDSDPLVGFSARWFKRN